MTRTLLHRLAVLPILLVGVTLLAFLLLHAVPGDPARALAGGRYATPQQIEQTRHQYGLDRSLPVQYERYVGNAVQGDLGQSFAFQKPVTKVLGERIPPTVELVGAALLLGVPIGLLLGIAAARRRDSWADHLTTLLSLAGVSIPLFWLGLMLAWLVSVKLGWLPLSGRLSPFQSLQSITGIDVLDALLRGQWSTFWDALRHLALPAITLSLVPLAFAARFARASFIEVLGQDYVRTARAYGIGEREIVWRHAAKNALLPLVTVLGIIAPALLVGAVLCEAVFAWPGLGSLLLGAMQARDYAVVQSVMLVMGLLFVVSTALVDLSYALLDPRTRRA